MRKQKSNGKRTPLRKAPLPVPGESLSRRFDELLMDKVLMWLILPAMCFAMALLHWVLWAINMEMRPIHYTLMTVVAIPVAAWQIYKAWPEMKAFKLGLEGERYMGQRLETLRRDGYAVFHDIPGDRGNVDHVLIGPSGVFVVETKTASKPERGECVVAYDGVTVSVNGATPQRDPIVQAKVCASEVGRILRESTGREAPIRPVVVYPGWFVRNESLSSEVWVLNDTALTKFIAHAHPKLDRTEVHLLAKSLAMHVRNERNNGL